MRDDGTKNENKAFENRWKIEDQVWVRTNALSSFDWLLGLRYDALSRWEWRRVRVVVDVSYSDMAWGTGRTMMWGSIDKTKTGNRFVVLCLWHSAFASHWLTAPPSHSHTPTLPSYPHPLFH